MFQAATIGFFLTLNTIVPVKSSKPDANYKLEKTFENIRSSIDSKVAENGHFKSFLSPDQRRKSNTDFSQLQEDVDKQMSGLDFDFDQNAYDKFHLPQQRPAKPKFVLNYEPLRPSNYISAPSTGYTDYPFSIPEHQDDGGDGGDDDDGGDDGGGGGGGGGGNGGGGGGGGNGGGGGGGNGGSGGGGGGGNGGGGGGGNGGGGNGGLGDGNDGRFIGHQSFEQDYDNFEPYNGWKPIHNKIQGSDVLENQFRIRPSAKKVAGYGTNRIPVTSNSYQKPYKQRPVNKKKQPPRFTDDSYTRKSVENKRPSRVFDDDDDDVQPLKTRGNSRRPLRLNGEKGRISYNNIRNNKPTAVLDEDTEDADEPRPLQSRRFPTKKRQVCQKMKKSMTPNDIEDHDIIGRKMSCMVCKDLASGGSYEKCSYKSDPISDEYFKEPKELNKFKINRFKRRVVYDRRRKQPESGEEVEDYEYDNVNAQESEEDPEYVQNADAVADYDSEDPENYETAENESEEYRLPPLPTKSSTCRKVMKEGNVCNVCRDNLTNRQYEQCEYEDDPKKNAYEYSTRNVYGNPRYKRQLDSDQTYDDYFKKLFPELGSNRKSSIATKFSSKDGDFGFLDNGQIGFKKTKSSLLGDKDLSIDFNSAEESPVNKMLGDFRNKDRSNCKKSLKDKMTCYKCKDDTGSETEECMYITDSAPKDRKQSYHETKKFNSSPELLKSTADAGKSNENHKQHQPASSSLTHVYAPLFGSSYEPTAQYSYIRPQYKHRNYRLHRKPVIEELAESTEDDDQSEAQSVEEYDYADDPSSKQVSRHDLPDVDPFGPEGAYSEETVPVYDPTLRTWLPRYMVVKTSEEAMVDAELGFD